MILKTNTILGVHSRKTGQTEICKRLHSASIESPVNVAEATLAKQAYL
jgi:hypothetical protein